MLLAGLTRRLYTWPQHHHPHSSTAPYWNELGSRSIHIHPRALQTGEHTPCAAAAQQAVPLLWARTALTGPPTSSTSTARYIPNRSIMLSASIRPTHCPPTARTLHAHTPEPLPAAPLRTITSSAANAYTVTGGGFCSLGAAGCGTCLRCATSPPQGSRSMCRALT